MHGARQRRVVRAPHHPRVERPAAVDGPQPAAVDQRAKRVHGEERVPLALRHEVGDECRVGRLSPERGPEPLGDVVRRQAGERDFGVALRPREPAAARIALLVQVFRADRETEQQALVGKAGGQVLERFPRRRVRPLGVVDDDRERTRRGDRRQELAEFVEERVRGRRRARVRGQRVRGLAELRHEPRELAPRAPRREPGAPRAEDDVRPRAVRGAHVGFEAPADQ